MRKNRLLALGLAALLTLSGCGRGEAEATSTPTPTPAPTPIPTPTVSARPVKFALPCYLEQSFHPVTGGNKTNLMLAPLMYEGLYELDGTFTAQNVLCESATVSEDGLTWSLNIRAGVPLSDGSILTASDVFASLKAARAEGSPYASRLAGIKMVQALNETQLTITLSAPNGNLPALLDVPIYKGGGERPLGTGPYALLEDGDGPYLALRPDWWRQKQMPMERIPLYPLQGKDAISVAFDTREISLAFADLTGPNALGYSGSYETWEYPTTVMLYVGYNTQKGSKCSEVLLRKAIPYAIERETTTKSLLSGHAAPASLPLPPASPLYDEALAGNYKYDLQRAGELLNEAGWAMGEDGTRSKWGSPLTLTLLTSAENTYKVTVAQHLADTLGELGVAVTVDSVPWSEYVARLEAGNFDLYLGETKLTADFDLTALIGPNGALNYGKYADAETQTLLAAYLASGGTERKTAAGVLYTRVAETAPFTPICFKTWSALTHWGRLTGLSPTQQNVFYGFDAWKWNG